MKIKNYWRPAEFKCQVSFTILWPVYDRLTRHAASLGFKRGAFIARLVQDFVASLPKEEEEEESSEEAE
jgi:hypothetical protein